MKFEVEVKVKEFEGDVYTLVNDGTINKPGIYFDGENYNFVVRGINNIPVWYAMLNNDQFRSIFKEMDRTEARLSETVSVSPESVKDDKEGMVPESFALKVIAMVANKSKIKSIDI